MLEIFLPAGHGEQLNESPGEVVPTEHWYQSKVDYLKPNDLFIFLKYY